MALPDLRKPAKGSGLIERKTRSKAIRAHEDGEKRKVRRRDVRCRWPNCEYCRLYKPRLEVAHVDWKGAGGDHGLRSDASNMLLLCFLAHQGPHSLHSGDRKVEKLTEHGTNGPLRYSEQTEAGWKVVHTEDLRWRARGADDEIEEDVA